MRFSLSTEYAIHGLLFLALQSPETVTMLPEVARAIQVSEPSLRKVFQTLARHGLVTSYRGTKGGYRLALPAQEITLKDVVEAIEGSAFMYRCISNQQQCEPGPRCVIGSAFHEVEDRISAALRTITLAGLVTPVQDGSKGVQWFDHPLTPSS